MNLCGALREFKELINTGHVIWDKALKQFSILYNSPEFIAAKFKGLEILIKPSKKFKK